MINILISNSDQVISCQHNFSPRREEKLYVEGMEDEDMKKETQNLAYPPAFKVATHPLWHQPFLAAGGGPVCEEAQPVCRRQDLQCGKAKDF